MPPDIGSTLQAINQYSNLILVLVTIAYVIFSWQTVREMRKARQEQLEAYLIASLEPLGAISASLCVRNVGQGTALNPEVMLSVKPRIERFQWNWCHPAIWSGDTEHFLLPYDNQTGAVPSLKQLAEQYTEVVVQIRWTSQFGKSRRQTFTFNLQEQVEGWYHAKHLLPGKSVTDHLEIMARHLDRMQREIQSIAGSVRVQSSRNAQSSDDQTT